MPPVHAGFVRRHGVSLETPGASGNNPGAGHLVTGYRHAWIDTGAAEKVTTLQGACHLNALEHLDLVTLVNAVVLDADTALGTCLDLVDVILEAPQGFKLAFIDHDVVAQYTNR